MKTTAPKRRVTSRKLTHPPTRKHRDIFAGMDPKFVAAAKQSKRRFGPLFKRLAKT